MPGLPGGGCRFIKKVGKGDFNVGSLRLKTFLEFLENLGDVLHGDLSVMSVENLNESTHVRALEVMREIHGQINGGDSVLAFVVAIQHGDWVPHVAYTDAIDGYSPGVLCILYVFHKSETLGWIATEWYQWAGTGIKAIDIVDLV